MSEPAIPGMRPDHFETRAAFQEAVLQGLASAQREILLADGTFTHWALNRPDIEATLRSFFHASRVNRLRLLTTADSHLLRDAPRLARVARDFSHAFAARITPASINDAFTLKFSLLVVDRARLVRRFHPDQMRGIAEFNPLEAEAWVDRFESAWHESSPGLATTTIGLST
jgi:hypothetical protein